MLGRSFTDWASYVRGPLVLACLLIILSIGSAFAVLPSSEEVFRGVQRLFVAHGVLMIGPISCIENLAVINLWFPGAVVILTAMALTYGDPLRAIATFIAIWIGSLIGLHVSYLGGYAISVRSPQALNSYQPRTKRTIWLLFASTFFHPQLASASCYGLGVERARYRDVVVPLFVANLGWNLFWGITTYHFGAVISGPSAVSWLFSAYVAGWLLWKTLEFFREDRAA